MLLNEDIKIILNCLHGKNEMMVLVKIRNRSVSDSKVISAWSARWSVHDQPRDQYMISLLISACPATWSVHAQSADQCMISFVIIHCSRKWSCTDHVADRALITLPIMHWSRGWSCTDHVPLVRGSSKRTDIKIFWKL